MPPPSTQSKTTATISLDAAGHILAASSSAAEWWAATEPEELRGLFLGELFVLDVLADTPEAREAEWDVLRESTREAPLPLTALPLEGEAFAVELLLKPDGDGYSANLKRGANTVGFSPSTGRRTGNGPPAPAPAQTMPTPAPTAQPVIPTPDTGTSWPGGIEGLAFFEIDVASGDCRFSTPWKVMLGYADNELENRHETLIKLIHPDDSDATPDHPEEGAPWDKRPYLAEFRMRHKNGAYIWVQSVGTKHFDGSGHISRVVGLHIDIQDRKLVEEEALENEDRFLTLLQRGNLAFFDLDFRHHTTYFSPAWQRLLGYDAGDLADMPDTFRKLLKPSEAQPDEWPRIFADPENRPTLHREMHLRHKDGTFYNLMVRLTRITNRHGDLLRVLGFVIEEEALTNMDEGTRDPRGIAAAALDHLQEGVVLADPDSRVFLMNPVARRLTGRDPAESDLPVLNEVLDLRYRHDGRPARDLGDEVLAAGNPVVLSKDLILAAADGTPREIVLSCHPLRDAAQRILGTVTIFRDPDEMSLTPEELVHSNRLHALGLLASGIAHDFNNLLTSIMGGVSLARETHETDILENAERACLDAKNLARQLLTFARGRVTGKKVVRVENTVRDTLRLATAGSQVRPEIDIESDLHLVEVELSRINQVFNNLIINAMQAMGDGGGKLRAIGRNLSLGEGEVSDLPKGDYVKITIEDSGPGIPPDYLDRIFEPFFTTKKQGTGLGLSTVFAVVRDHEGVVTVSSQMGKGTAFAVYLPKTDKPLEEELKRAPELKFGTGRILFMDDDKDLTELAAGMLKRLDYECDLAKNGEEALALYRRYLKVDHPYDAVILDLTIAGGMGGEETLQHLLDLDPEVRAIVSSGYNSEETADYYLAKGFKGVLAKPYRSEDMGKVLRRVLGKA